MHSSSPTPTQRAAGSPEEELLDAYHRLFEVREADTPSLRAEAYRLRYQVYCVENEFLSRADNPGGLETDEHDHHSRHGLLYHRATRSIAGTVRVILPASDGRADGLPIHAVCRHPALRDPERLPPETTAEFSRLAISKQFRQRLNDKLYGQDNGADIAAENNRRIIPHMTLGLMSIAVEFMVDHGIDYVCAVMEPTLLRLLTRLGIHFERLGPPVEYHGLRQPVYRHLGDLLAQIRHERPDVWAVITDRGRLWKPLSHSFLQVPARLPLSSSI